MRKIEKILSPKSFQWVGDGFYTTSFVGGDITRHRLDPFFAIGYNAEIEFPSSKIPKGVGVHPHKGFETVTFAYKGKMEHRDSRGNHGILNEGEVQWMTAGSGILHEEFHEKEWSKNGGAFQMVQLWVNLPAKDKNTTPKYQNLVQIPKVNLTGGTVQVVAGEYEGVKGTASTLCMYII
jgi:redox-sensitive bicupin YhaK (pirin superfamily)